MIRSRLCLLLAGAALLTLPSAASAQTCQAPPGTAAIDQYCESIPGATGDRGTPGPGGGRGGTGAPGGRPGTPAGGPAGAPLSPSAREALREAGPAGQGVLALVESERRAGGGAGVGAGDGRAAGGGGPAGERTPGAAGGRAAEGSGSGGGGAPPVAAPQGGSPLEAVTRAVGESGQTVGPAFLWVMLGLGLLVGGAGWLRYRGRMGPGGAPPAVDR